MQTHISESAREAPLRCVIIDDHHILAEALSELLGKQGIEVVGMESSGEAGLEMLRRLRPEVALVDMRLDGPMDGLAAAAAVRDAGLETRVVIFTASDSPANLARALASGASGYVTKSNRGQTVVDSLRAAAAGKRFVDPALAAEMVSPSRPPLSEREHEVLQMLGQGMQNDGVAHALGVSTETVKTHVSQLFTKLGVQSRTHAVAVAIRGGIID